MLRYAWPQQHPHSGGQGGLGTSWAWMVANKRIQGLGKPFASSNKFLEIWGLEERNYPHLVPDLLTALENKVSFVCFFVSQSLLHVFSC